MVLALTAGETVWVGIVSGAAGGVIVLAARALYDAKVEKRARRRIALEAFVKDVSPLRKRFTAAALDSGGYTWESHDRWWPDLDGDFNVFADRWYGEWGYKIHDAGLASAVRKALGHSLGAVEADSTGAGVMFMTHVKVISQFVDEARQRAIELLGGEDLDATPRGKARAGH